MRSEVPGPPGPRGVPTGALDPEWRSTQYLLTSHHTERGGEARLSTIRGAAALAALLALLAPVAGAAKPIGDFRFVVADPGDQRDPSVDGQYVVYAGPGPNGDLDILLHDFIVDGPLTVAGGPGDQDSPDLSGLVGVFRDPAGISIVDWYRGLALRSPTDAEPVSAPAAGTGAVAWEVGRPGSRDIVVHRLLDGAEYVLSKVGDQHSPSVDGSLVAWVDDADGGAIWIHDAATTTTTRFRDGRARSVSVAAGPSGPRLVAAARQVAGPDDDVEVYDPAGNLLAALRVNGVQRSPHVAGDWIAFEDLSTSFSQVVVWNFRTGLIFVPRPSETDQTLNDVAMGDTELRVVFEDSESPATGRDIALYRLETDPLLEDDTPTGWPIVPPPPPPPPPPERPASCDDPDAIVLATLELGRSTGKPLADLVRFPVEGSRSSVLPVLVCIDAVRVSAAWITLDGEAVATPCDFRPEVVHLEVPAEVRGSRGCLAGIVGGKPGATLTARVLAAPPRPVPSVTAPADPPTGPGPGGEPGNAPDAGHASGAGCGTAGGLASLLPLLLLLARRREP